MVFRYLWDGKPEKINRKRVCQDYLHGGMRMVDVFNFEKSLKLSWLKQLNIDNKKTLASAPSRINQLNSKVIYFGARMEFKFYSKFKSFLANNIQILGGIFQKQSCILI